MTPEQAREIDRLDFEADCRRARERASARVAELQRQREAKAREWIAKPAPKGLWALSFDAAETPPDEPSQRRRSEATVRLNGERRISLTYRGTTMTLTEWSNAIGISPRTLRSRIAYGWPVERILTEPASRCRPRGTTSRPGVASNFADDLRTGAPSNARDFSQLEISE